MKTTAFFALCLAALVTAGCGDSEVSESSLAEPEAISYQFHTLNIKSIKQGWNATGLVVAVGDEVTIAARGEVEIGIGHPLEPRHALWGRVGESGNVFQLATNHHSFESTEAGELFVTMSPSGLLWSDRQGGWSELIAQMPDAPLDLQVDAFLWDGTAKAGLNALLDVPETSALASQALAAINATRTLPEGYDYLWYLSQANIFAGFSDAERSGVHAATADDFGIIKRPLDIPLTPGTEISFQWLYKSLPALASETDAASHDYLSIAIEFDNGQDITWMWSRDLPVETIFKCPLPEWHHRETHIVLQSGVDGLGEWHGHTRSITDDYVAAVGGEVPQRIVGVWVITNAVFGLQPAEAFFANAVVSDGEVRHPVM